MSPSKNEHNSPKFKKISQSELEKYHSLLTGLCKDYKGSKCMGLYELATLHNAGICLLSLQNDLMLLREQLVLASHKQAQSVLARHIAIAVYEGAKDLPIIFGKKYRDALAAAEVDNSILGELGLVIKPVSQFYTKYKNGLSSIRNYLAAHREHIGWVQVSLIEAIDPTNILLLTMEFMRLLVPIVHFNIRATAEVHQLTYIKLVEEKRKKEKSDGTTPTDT
jgi:hypothetical protein